MPCMCGADDCHRCHPENFRGRIYIGDMDEDEIKAAVDAEEDAAVARQEAHDEAVMREYPGY